MIIFDYKAKVGGKDFEGNEGKNIQLILGRDLFIKGFDDQLLGVKKNENKSVSVKLPENYPKKELVNKKTNFNCKIINLKRPIEIKIDDEFAKKMGAKDIIDLKSLVKNQISKEYKGSLDSITKKDILEQIEKSHSLDLPPNLIEQETKVIAQGQKKEEIYYAVRQTKSNKVIEESPKTQASFENPVKKQIPRAAGTTAPRRAPDTTPATRNRPTHSLTRVGRQSTTPSNPFSNHFEL